MGGAVYLNAGDDLNTIVNQNIGIGRSWAFYYGKQTNNKGDVLWESVVYIKGELKYKRITVWDNKERVIASCEIDLITGQKTNKRKCFYGDPSVFFYSFGDETNPNIKFWYNEDDTIEEVFYYDDDYTLDEFLANQKIMAQFPWDQHTYFHSFEPMLPDGNTNVSPQYQRNYEENVGVSKYEPATNKLYENYFVENISFGIKNVVDNFINSLNAISKNDTSAYTKIKTLVETSAKSLWDTSVSFVKSTMPDDRPLYWARIKMQIALKKHPYFLGQFTGSEINSGSNLEKVLQIFEEKSRNYTGVDFLKAPTGAKKILITGFDPFQLNYNIEQWNPSGLSNLFLHNEMINNCLIQSMIFPVRFQDFDKGYIEKYIFPHINNLDMIITISQGRNRFDIERFASKYRTKTNTDNLNIYGVNHIFYLPINNIITAVNETQIPEFLQTTLPISNMIPGSLGNVKVVYNQQYESDKSFLDYSLENSGTQNLPAPNTNKVAISGSGGDYLSNEIFFRVAVLRNYLNLNNNLKSGHLHVPILSVNDYVTANNYNLEIKKIIEDATKGL